MVRTEPVIFKRRPEPLDLGIEGGKRRMVGTDEQDAFEGALGMRRGGFRNRQGKRSKDCEKEGFRNWIPRGTIAIFHPPKMACSR